jgi:hypothetical protein
MICELVKDCFSSYPTKFLPSINLQESVDPFTQSSLYELSKRAFKVGMPYYAFCLAQLETGRYVAYDAVFYRLSRYNAIQNHELDPCSRIKIKNIFFFALSKDKEDQAIPYPLPSYRFLKDTKEFPGDKIERYAFSALNYYVIEEGKEEDIERLKNIHKMLKYALSVGSRDERDPTLRKLWSTEIKKWDQVQFN